VLVLVVVPVSGVAVVVVVVVLVLDSGIAVLVVVPVSVVPPPQAVKDATRARLAAASAIVSNFAIINVLILLIVAADRPNSKTWSDA
jgi:hypothetical protein